MTDRLLKLTKRISSEKIITSEKLNIYRPDQFHYYHQLGAGAYGMVRKCGKKPVVVADDPDSPLNDDHIPLPLSRATTATSVKEVQ